VKSEALVNWEANKKLKRQMHVINPDNGQVSIIDDR
jgi:hypothetical protein